MGLTVHHSGPPNYRVQVSGFYLLSAISEELSFE